jgi:hypothetical protein
MQVVYVFTLAVKDDKQNLKPQEMWENRSKDDARIWIL